MEEAASEEPGTEDTESGGEDAEETEAVAGQEVIGSEFSQDIFSPGRERAKFSRRQKREDRYQHAVEAGAGSSRHSLELPTEEMRTLQKQDGTLQEVQKAADGQSSSAGIGFFRRNGLLYRRWTPPGRDTGMAIEQLVLPTCCRKTVLQVADEIPLAGHMGREKTSQAYPTKVLLADTLPLGSSWMVPNVQDCRAY